MARWTSRRALSSPRSALKEEILMRRKTALLALAVSLCTLAAWAGGPSKLPPAGYDKTRDPAADLAAAIPQAQRENKRILLEVGANGASTAA